eukprot:tig00021537_g22299.t1
MATATVSSAPYQAVPMQSMSAHNLSGSYHQSKHTHADLSVKTWAQPPIDENMYKTLEMKTLDGGKEPYSDDLRRVGLFHDPYLWPELYVDPQVGGATANFSRNKGKQFQTGPPRKGQTHKGLSPFRRLYEGEPPAMQGPKERAEPPFMRGRPHGGEFGPRYPHIPDQGSVVAIPGRNGESYRIYDGGRRPPQHEPGNMRTKPGGGTLSGPAKYEPDDYERQERERRSRVSGYGNGFRPSSHPSRAWKDTRKQPGHINDPNSVAWADGTRRPGLTSLRSSPLPPFRPSHPARIGYNMTLSGFPEYMPDAREEEPLRREHEKIWLKADRMHSKPQPSILMATDKYDNHSRG